VQIGQQATNFTLQQATEQLNCLVPTYESNIGYQNDYVESLASPSRHPSTMVEIQSPSKQIVYPQNLEVTGVSWEKGAEKLEVTGAMSP